MFDRLTLDSSNSSIPPSSDPNRKKDSKENDEVTIQLLKITS
jgi:hypothetical protein